MAEIVHTDCKLYLDGYDLSGSMNAIALNYGADMKDGTTFGSGGTRKNIGGLKAVDAAHEGLFEPSALDAALFSEIGVDDKPMTICPTDGSDGAPAYFFKSDLAQYSPGGSVGELLGFSVSASCTDGDLYRGSVMINASALSSSGTGTGYPLGVLQSGYTRFAALHVTACSGTLDVKIQSAAATDSAFSSPTDRITFTQANGITSEVSSVDGAISDIWWRVDYTISGTASFVVVMENDAALGLPYATYVQSTAVNHWRLGDASGDATDSVGSDDLSWTGTPTYGQTGLVGDDSDTCMYVDGTAYASKTITNYRSSDTQGAIELIFKTSTSGDRLLFFSGNNTEISDHRVQISISSLGAIRFKIRTTTDLASILTTTTGLDDGAKHHLIVTSTGSAYKIYIDGNEEAFSVESGSDDGSWFSSVSSRNNVAIAVDLDSSPTAIYDGYIDEVSVHDTTLTAVDAALRYIAMT